MENKTKINDDKYLRLVGWANKMSFYYYSPVYLVGSSIFNKSFRDVDIVIVLKDRSFEHRFFSVQRYVDEAHTGDYSRDMWALSKECNKRYTDGITQTGLNLDLKIIPETFWQVRNNNIYPNTLIIKLDTSDYQ